MTQHMGIMDFSDEEEDDELEKTAIGHLKLLGPHPKTLGWRTRDFGDGETTIGRNDGQGITISDPSVSGSHAAIDVVDLPDAGGKRITLKDLRSMNGTYIVNAETGANTRLAPRKATMLPVDGCKIQFGNVVCKVVMGPAPALPDAAQSEDGAGDVGIYDADTQLPGDIDLSEADDDKDPEAAGDDGNDTQPLRDTGPHAHTAGDVRPTEKNENDHSGAEAHSLDAGAEERRQDQAIGEDVREAEEKDQVGRLSGASGDERAEGGAGVGVAATGANIDGGHVSEANEPSTQHVVLEIEDSSDDDNKRNEEEDQKEEATGEQQGGGDQDANPGPRPREQAEQAADAQTASAQQAVISSDVGVADGAGGGNRDAAADSGDETADERETAGLFHTQEEEDVANNAAAVGTQDRGVGGGAGEDSSLFTARGTEITRMSPATEPEYPVRALLASPGGTSEATTQIEESPGKGPSHVGESNLERRGTSVVAYKGGSACENGEGEQGHAVIWETEVRSPPQAAGATNDGEASEEDDDNDDCSSASSGALIPAGQDLAGFEDKLDSEDPDNEVDDNTPPEQHQTAVDAVNATVDGIASGTNGGADAAADESGSETDVTEADSDDGVEGAAEVIRPKSPFSSRRGADSPPPAALGSGSIGRAATSIEVPRERDSITPGDVRSPGGTLLRRTTTEDAMQAIAREQQRAEAAGAAAAAARMGARDIADESDESEDPQTEMELPPAAEPAVEADLGDKPGPGLEPEPETQAMDFQPENDSLAPNLREGEDVGDSEPEERRDENTSRVGTAGAAVAESASRPSIESAGKVEEAPNREKTGAASAVAVSMAVPMADGTSPDDSPLHEAQDDVDDGMPDQMDEDERQEDKRSGREGNTEGEPSRPVASTATPVRSSGRRRTKPKAFDEMEPSGTARGIGSDKGTEKVGASAMGVVRGGKRRRSSLTDSEEAGAVTEATTPSSPIGGARKRGRRSSTPAATIEGKPEISQQASAQSSTSGLAKVRKQRASLRPQNADAETLEADETPADATADADETKGKRKENGRSDGQGVRGSKRLKVGDKEQRDEENPDGGGGSTGREEDTTPAATNTAGKGSSKRKAAGSGGSQGVEDSEDFGDEHAAVPATPASGRRRRKTARKGRAMSVEKGTEGSQLEGAEEVAGTPAPRGQKGKGKGSTPAPAPSTRGKSSPAKPTAASTPTNSSGRGRGRSSPPSPKAGAFARRSASIGSIGGNPEQVKVCFTSLAPGKKERDCIRKLGVSEAENVLEATHLVAGGAGVPLKRTPKLLAGIGRCRFVVSVEWLHQSAEKRQILDGLEYVLCDAEAEKKYGFRMRSSLGRRSDRGLLAGLSVHVDPAIVGVQGMRCPPSDEMKMVVESAGGTWLSQIPKGGVKDPDSLLVISHPDALNASGAKGSKSRAIAACGRGGRAYLPEMMFLCILRQSFSWPDALAVGGGEAGKGDEGASSAQQSSAQKGKPAKRRR